jgi:RsmE family RNA methyltransferase
MNILLLENEEIDGSNMAVVDDDRARHIRKVLKAQPGQLLRAGCVDGPRGTCRVASIDGHRVTLEWTPGDPLEPRCPVSLLLAVPRPKVLKRLWAQLAAMGVDQIILSNAWKVERPYFDTHVLDPDFYRARLKEGLAQAGATRLPRVSIHRRLRVLVEDELPAMGPWGQCLVADPAATQAIPAVLPQPGPDRVLLAVGPEGGWIPDEVDLLKRHGFIAVGLGPRILRTDTACIALLAILHQALASC